MSAQPPSEPGAASPAPTAPTERPGLFLRVRGHLSLSRVQAIFGLVAALLSIGGALYGYLRPGRAPHAGELLAVVQEARSGKAVTDATVELLTHRWRLDQADEAYQLFDRQTTGKGVFAF